MNQTIHELLHAALSVALPNTWAKELPEEPTFPAATFAVDSKPEDSWTFGGGYVGHDVSLVVLARDLDDLDVLLPVEGGGPFRAALEALDCYQFEDDSGDADYEPDPQVFGRYLSVRLRTPIRPT